MPGLPTGTVTFLFTDIEGSTELLQHLGDALAAEVFHEHRRLVRNAFAAGGGLEVQDQGDGFLYVFQRARDAVTTALQAQLTLKTNPWLDGAMLRVRMGVHTGEPIIAADGYMGLDVHRAARICDAGHGGQILLSRSTRDLIEHELQDEVGLRDLGAHRLKDLHRPERIFQLVHPHLPADFLPLRSLDAVTNNLPIQLSSFVGREEEIAQAKGLLSKTRLLTLTGSGGCGKTRLALQVAAEVLEEFKRGVWWVELASVADPALVPQAVASALNVREQPGRTALAALTEYLGPKHLLLVLDNCEHLVDACARLVEILLKTCPSLQILATSRQPLGIEGETTWRVPSLSLPDSNARRPQDLARSDAARLFMERAVAVVPEFTMTDHNAEAIAEVCCRLDGIPLAIELASTRVKVLTVDQIVTRLDDRLQLLVGGRRTALPRQQTLRATMDWSYELLTDAERALLRRLSVFAGGWTLEGAEAICGGAELENQEVLGVLSRLVDKSLVVVEQRGRAVRYRLLETVRQYARERLLEAAEEARVRKNHRDWYLGWRSEQRVRRLARTRKSGETSWRLSTITCGRPWTGASQRWTAPKRDCGSLVRWADSGVVAPIGPKDAGG